MNERIRDMLEQPVFDRLRDWYNIGPVQRATLEEFAELIVKECAAVCMKEVDTGLMMTPQDPWMAEQILKHFGVE